MRKLAKYILWAIGLGILGIGLVFFINIYIVNSSEDYIYNNINDVPESQAALVPGAMVYSNGELYYLTKDRADIAIKLYKAGKVKKILVSGDHGHDNYDEVNTIRNYILKSGIAPEDVFMDHAGFDTYSSMYRARDVFKVTSLVVCTQQFHLNRAVFLGRNLGLEASGIAANSKLISRWNTTREKMARVKAFIAAKITHPKPHFLGDPIPITGDGRLTEDKR